jgi:hypothetical protein
MSSVNYTNPNRDKTVKLFDDFYKFELYVDANLYDAVYSYFKTVTEIDEDAKNFALNLFRISESAGTPVLDMLDSIKGQNVIQLTTTFAYYLNNLRSNSTLLGISATVTPTFYAARNILP